MIDRCSAKPAQDIITVNNLVEVYSDGTKAVDNILFNVEEGEFFSFLGPNDRSIFYPLVAESAK